MKNPLFLLLFLFSMCSITGEEIDFNFIRPDDIVYSTITGNFDGDEYTDYIINFMTQSDYSKLQRSPSAYVTIDNSYFATVNSDGIDVIHHLDNSRYQFFSIKEYSKLSEYYTDSQLGALKGFFFVKDFNQNGIDEIYFIEFAWYEQYFVGYEFNGSEFKKIIDVDINGLYTKNFNNWGSNELTLLRGVQYPNSHEIIEPGINRDWMSYFIFNQNSGEYEEVKTEEVRTRREEFY